MSRLIVVCGLGDTGKTTPTDELSRKLNLACIHKYLAPDTSKKWEGCYTNSMIKVATLWLLNEHGELLLARRADHKKQDPSVWGPTVTGKLEKGETFDETLAREVEEELSLEPSAYDPHFLLEYEYAHPDGEQRLFSVYWARVPKSIESEIHIDLNEVAEVKWVSVENTQEMLAHVPEKLVPSAAKVWPPTFEKLKASPSVA